MTGSRWLSLIGNRSRLLGRVLDRLYDLAGALAALAIVLICLLISAQIVLNIVSRLAGTAWSATIPSYADFAGFLLAAASFLALAHTLRRGGHIRVAILTDRLPLHARWLAELAALGGSAALAGYATWYAVALVAESHAFGDQSRGMVAVPLWIPQLSIAIGLGLLTVALLHTLCESLAARRPVVAAGGEGE